MANFSVFNYNAPKSKTSLEKVLPNIAKDISIVKSNMVKLVGMQGGTPKTKAESFFSGAANREREYESQFKKSGLSPSRSDSKSSKSSKGGGLFSSDTSIFDFIKSIANKLIKGLLVVLGGMGIAKLLENEEVRKTIKTFVKDVLVTVLDLIQKGLKIIQESLTENWTEIKKSIMDTYKVIVDTLIVALDKVGDLLSGESGKIIFEGIYSIIKQIFKTIHKILSTKVNIEGFEVSLYEVVIALGAAFYGLSLAAAAAASALTGLAAGKAIPGGGRVPAPGSPAAPAAPVPAASGKADKLTSKEKLARNLQAKESWRKISLDRSVNELTEGMKSKGRMTNVLAILAALGIEINKQVVTYLDSLSIGELDVLAGNGDDTGLAAAIIAEGKRTELEKNKKSNTPLPAANTNSNVPKVNTDNESRKSKPYPNTSSNSPNRIVSARDLLNQIAKVESGGSYNATLGYGKFDPEWFKKGSKKLTDLSMKEIYTLQTDMLGNSKNKFNSSAVGKYQIVRTTLFGKRGTAENPEAGSIAAVLGLEPEQKFTPEVQENIGMALLKRRGLDNFVSGKIGQDTFFAELQKEWQGFGNTGITSLVGLQNPDAKGERLAETSSYNQLAKLGSNQVNMVNSNNVVNNNSESSKESTPAAQVSSPFDERMFFESMVKQLFV
jgi:muramidase (phage lysozyme)